jgi:phage terminase Nu1 subunit (DNA packaging protein)
MARRQLDREITTAELAMLLGASDVVISQLERRGVIHKTRYGYWPLKKTVRALVRHYREIAARRGGAAIGALVVAKARLARERADEVAMQNAKMRAEFVPAAEVRAYIAECNEIVRTRLLALPAEIAPQLHACRTVVEHQTMLRALLSEALENLAGEFAGRRERLGSA